MATTDPVEIVVEIVNQTKDDIAEIKKDLKEIGLRDVDVDLDINSAAEIAETQAQIEALDNQSIEPDLNVRSAVKDITGRTIAESVDEWIPFDEGMHPMGPIDLGVGGGAGPRRAGAGILPDDMPFQMLSRWTQRNTEKFRNLGRTLLEYRPSIMDWWNVLALLIPIMISLAGAALGLAAALGAVGTAGLAIVGLGLLGWGEDMQSTVQNLQEDLRILAKDLFAVAKPLGDLFQPIVERWMKGLDNQARRLVDPIRELVVFTDGLAAAGAGLVGWIGEVISAMASMDEMAEQVVLRFGEAFGEFLIDALSAMLREVHRNQDAYINMAELLLDVIVIIFNVSKAVTILISTFQPLFRIVAGLTNFLSNRFIITFLTIITTVLALEAVVTGLSAAFVALNTATIAAAASWMSSLLPSMSAVMSQLATFIGLTEAATFSWLRLAAVTGAGLLIAGGGIVAGRAVADSMTPPSRSGGEQQIGGTTVINVDGDVRKREVDRIVDEMGPQTRRENSINRSMSGNG